MNTIFLVNGDPADYLPSTLDGTEIAPWVDTLYVHLSQYPDVKVGDHIVIATGVFLPVEDRTPERQMMILPFASAEVVEIEPHEPAHKRIVFRNAKPIEEEIVS